MKIFPNPSNEILHIELSNNAIIEKIKFFDITGKKVKSFNYLEKELDVSEFTPGVYYLKISTTKGEITKKIFIE